MNLRGVTWDRDLKKRSHRFVHGNFEAGLAAEGEEGLGRPPPGRDRPLAVPDELLRQRAEAVAGRGAVGGDQADGDRRASLLARLRRRADLQPYLRFDRNDYSLDPRLVGRRVEIRASQAEITAIALDTGEIVARHRRVFAGGLAFTDPAHQAALDELRGERKRRRTEPAVEVRPLERYDALIPA